MDILPLEIVGIRAAGIHGHSAARSLFVLHIFHAGILNGSEIGAISPFSLIKRSFDTLTAHHKDFCAMGWNSHIDFIHRAKVLVAINVAHCESAFEIEYGRFNHEVGSRIGWIVKSHSSFIAIA